MAKKAIIETEGNAPVKRIKKEKIDKKADIKKEPNLGINEGDVFEMFKKLNDDGSKVFEYFKLSSYEISNDGRKMANLDRITSKGEKDKRYKTIQKHVNEINNPLKINIFKKGDKVFLDKLSIERNVGNEMYTERIENETVKRNVRYIVLSTSLGSNAKVSLTGPGRHEDVAHPNFLKLRK
jgi:hypothetical protein